MDNATHALAGLLLAELSLRVTTRGKPPPSATAVRAAYLASALANNMPDFDFVYLGITGGKIGYLLHHRGHTHTFLLAVPLGLIAWAAARGVFRKSWGELLALDRQRILGLSLVGGLLHISMDFCNNYGVHPLWPASGRWFYGDSVYIVEPLFWVAAVPAMLFATRHRIGRGLLLFLLSAACALPWVFGNVPRQNAAVVVVLAGLSAWGAWRLDALKRALLGSTLVALVLGMWVATGRVAERRVRRLSVPAGFTTHEIAMTPNGANPLCWRAIVVQSSASEYRMQELQLTLSESLSPQTWCPPKPKARTAPMTAGSAQLPGGMRGDGEFRAQLAELSRVLRSCQARAFMQYTRVPFWTGAGDSWVLGDLRYDRSAELDFAEIEVNAADPCPDAVTAWRPPRADVMMRLDALSERIE